MATYSKLFMKDDWSTAFQHQQTMSYAKPEIEFVTYAFSKGSNPAYSVTHATTQDFSMGVSDAYAYKQEDSYFTTDYSISSKMLYKYSQIANDLKPVKGNASIYYISANVSTGASGGVLDVLISHIMQNLPDAVTLNPHLKSAIDVAVRKAFKIP